MSISADTGISFTVVETGKVDGVRAIKGYQLVIPNSYLMKDINGGTDYFEGVGCKLTIAEAEAIYKQLGASLAFIKPLLESGKIKETK